MAKLPDFLQNLDPRIFLSDNYLVVDFETTNKDKGSALNQLNELVLWVAHDGKRSYSGKTVKRLLNLVQRADFIVAHNAKFELQWLYRLGIKPSTVFCFDTMLGEYCILGNRKEPLDLDSVAARYGLEQKESIVSKMIKGGVCPSEIPEARLYEYCKQDVLLTWQLFLKLRTKLDELGLLPTAYTRNLTCICLADIESHGMMLDREDVEKEYRKVSGEAKKLLARIHELTGGINPKSPKQIAEYLYDNLKFDELRDYNGDPIRTEKGGRKTGEDTVAVLKPTNQAQKDFLEAFRAYIPYKKKLETLEKMYECCVQSGGILRFNYNQSVTSTHRLSSSGGTYKVQGQNIDRELKRLFRARHDGWVVADCDGGQIEFRAAGHLGNDSQIKSDLANKVDVHRNTAGALLNKAPDQVTKDERTHAKPRTFAPLYGSNSGSPAEKRYNKFFRQRYSGIYKTQTKWTHEVAAKKFLVTQTGLRFYWPDCTVYDSGYVKYTTDIFNYPIQSFCGAELIPVSLVYCWAIGIALGLRGYIVNTIHDSVIWELPMDEVGVWQELVKAAFTRHVFEYMVKVYKIDLTVPLSIAYSAAPRWGQGKDEEYELSPEPF